MLRSFLLAPCLLICLACATPFPIEKLEEGMTYETVRENFGEPEAIETEPEGVGSSWTYVDEELLWMLFLHAPFAIPICAAIPGTPWDYMVVNRRPILLHFEAEKLVRWNVGEFNWTDGSGYYDPALFPTMTFPSIDAAHHAKGHKHHHPDC